MQNVVGPTLVAMATKFRLGAEIQSPTGLLVVKVQHVEISSLSIMTLCLRDVVVLSAILADNTQLTAVVKLCLSVVRTLKERSQVK